MSRCITLSKIIWIFQLGQLKNTLIQNLGKKMLFSGRFFLNRNISIKLLLYSFIKNMIIKCHLETWVNDCFIFPLHRVKCWCAMEGRIKELLFGWFCSSPYDLLIDFWKHLIKAVLLRDFPERKCLFAHSVCANFGLNAHSVCANFGLNAHSPSYFITLLK